MNNIFNIVDGPLANIYQFLNIEDLYNHRLKYVNRSTKEVVIRTMHIRLIYSPSIFIEYIHLHYLNRLNIIDYLIVLKDITLNISLSCMHNYIGTMIFNFIRGRDHILYNRNFNDIDNIQFRIQFRIQLKYRKISYGKRNFCNSIISNIVQVLNIKEDINILKKLYILAIYFKIPKYVDIHQDFIVTNIIQNKKYDYIYYHLFALIRCGNLKNFKYCMKNYFKHCPLMFNINIYTLLIREIIFNKGHEFLYVFDFKNIKISYLDLCGDGRCILSSNCNFKCLESLIKLNAFCSNNIKYELSEMFRNSIMRNNLRLFKLIIPLITSKMFSYKMFNAYISKFINWLFERNQNEFIKHLLTTNFKNIVNPCHIYLWAMENNITEYIIKYSRYARIQCFNIKKYSDYKIDPTFKFF